MRALSWISLAAITTGCAGMSVGFDPRGVGALFFEPRPTPVGFRAHPVRPAERWLTGEGREVLGLRLGEVQWTGHRPPSGEMSWIRGSITARGAGEILFSCARRQDAEERTLACFIDELDTGDVRLLAVASRAPWGHRVGYLSTTGPLGTERDLRLISDAPVLYTERVFFYGPDEVHPLAVGDKEQLFLAPEVDERERGPALALLLLTAIPFHLDQERDGPPMPSEDGELAVFEGFDQRFPSRLVAHAPEGLSSTERQGHDPLMAGLRARGATLLADAAATWAMEEPGVRADYAVRSSRSRALGFSAELSLMLGSAATLDGFEVEGRQGAPVQTGFAIAAGPTLFRHLVLQGEVGLGLPLVRVPTEALGLTLDMGPSGFFYAGGRARVVFTEPDDEVAFYLGASHHWFLGSASTAEETLRLGFTGRRAGGFGGGEMCVVGGYYERLCFFSELGASYTWVRFGDVSGPLEASAEAERLRQATEPTEGWTPELRLGVRFGF